MTVYASRARLGEILRSDRSVAMASVFDPISARIAQELGFEVGLMGGSLASLAVLGAPDLILITLTELADQVRRSTRVSRVPLVVDGDHGYGNALNVMRTIEELGAAGAAAVSIEDTLLPRAFDSSETAQLLSVEEGAGKLEAAVEARGDAGPLVLGRTSAAALTGVEDAIARFRAYEAAGVDALMIPAVPSRAVLDRISAATRLPLVAGGMPPSMCDASYLAARRVRLWSSGHQAVNVAIQALYQAMKAVSEGTLAPALPGVATKETMRTVTAADDYDARLRSFMTASRSAEGVAGGEVASRKKPR
jgi:carboxyvinyl-carboxyphosphonate phosphorylmutase